MSMATDIRVRCYGAIGPDCVRRLTERAIGRALRNHDVSHFLGVIFDDGDLRKLNSALVELQSDWSDAEEIQHGALAHVKVDSNIAADLFAFTKQKAFSLEKQVEGQN